MTIGEAHQKFTQALISKYEAREAANIANIVFEELTGLLPYERIIRKQDALQSSVREQLADIEKRLLEDYPLQYLLQKAPFWDFELWVDESVLIPRPETEELVAWISKEEKQSLKRVLDIGAGSGCIALTLQKICPEWSVDALELSEKAIRVIRENEKQVGVNLHQIITGDFLDKNCQDKLGRYDIIVSNPPYIPEQESGEMLSRVVGYEPEMALFVPNERPYIFYDAILDFAVEHLQPDGKIYFEIHESFGDEIVDLCQQKGFAGIIKKDLQNKDRMVQAYRK